MVSWGEEITEDQIRGNSEYFLVSFFPSFLVQPICTYSIAGVEEWWCVWSHTMNYTLGRTPQTSDRPVEEVSNFSKLTFHTLSWKTKHQSYILESPVSNSRPEHRESWLRILSFLQFLYRIGNIEYKPMACLTTFSARLTHFLTSPHTT
jgi:hypothetical protein